MAKINIEQDLALVLNEQYNRLREAGSDKTFSFMITAHVSGYGNEGMKITYQIGAYGDTDKTVGSGIDAVITEYMRRKKWTENNKPMILIDALSIDHDPQPDTDDREPANT